MPERSPAKQPTSDSTALSAVESLQAVASRERRLTDIVSDHVAAAQRDQSHAIVALNERALDEALAFERRLEAGEDLPLAGLVLTVKDNIAVAGMCATAGSRLLVQSTAQSDAASVARLRQLGAVLLGKTNCPEFALQARTQNRLFPDTLNPAFPGRSPGGSSGGCAAAVAAHLSHVSLGTDYGGSVRYPAHCCGIVGLRPTPGRWSSAGQYPAPPPSSPRFQYTVIGPLTRSVDDMQLVVRALAIGGSIDRADPRPIRRVAVLASDDFISVDPNVGQALEQAAIRLRKAGVEVAEVDPPALHLAAAVFDTLRALDDYSDLRELSQGREQLLTSHVRALLAASSAKPVSLIDALEAVELRARVRAQMLAFLDDWDAMVWPVAPSAAPPMQPPDEEAPAVDRADDLGFLGYCRVISLFGLPAVSVRAGVNSDGSSVNVQLVGRPRSEDLLINLSRRLQDHEK